MQVDVLNGKFAGGTERMFNAFAGESRLKPLSLSHSRSLSGLQVDVWCSGFVAY